jgi:hypothetical protein
MDFRTVMPLRRSSMGSITFDPGGNPWCNSRPDLGLPADTIAKRSRCQVTVLCADGSTAAYLSAPVSKFVIDVIT